MNVFRGGGGSVGAAVLCLAMLPTNQPTNHDNPPIDPTSRSQNPTYPTHTLSQRRFDPNFSRVKRAILEGEVGNIVQVKLCSRDPSPPPFEYVKGGGGIFKVSQ